jgi:hypothetical protein
MTQASCPECASSADSRLESVQDTLVRESRSSIVQSAARSLPLARGSHWPATTTLQKLSGPKSYSHTSNNARWTQKGGLAMIKKLPVQSDVPKLLVLMAYNDCGTDRDKAVVDLTMILFYYRLRIGEYTVKKTQNSTKQTVQFKYEDVTFLCKNNRGQLQCLPQNAPDELIATVDGAMLKLDNQKNGWKGVCVYHETNSNDQHCLVRALGCRHLHLQHHGATAKTFLSAYFTESKERGDISSSQESCHCP